MLEEVKENSLRAQAGSCCYLCQAGGSRMCPVQPGRRAYGRPPITASVVPSVSGHFWWCHRVAVTLWGDPVTAGPQSHMGSALGPRGSMSLRQERLGSPTEPSHGSPASRASPLHCSPCVREVLRATLQLCLLVLDSVTRKCSFFWIKTPGEKQTYVLNTRE